jgi:hypothetical protein
MNKMMSCLFIGVGAGFVVFGGQHLYAWLLFGALTLAGVTHLLMPSR